MARPRKRRRVCSLPRYNRFGPLGNPNKKFINMSVDEYETIRLIDYEGLNQEEASKEMNVARTTVQSIYQEARIKLSKSLIEGLTIIIEGGDFELHNHNQRFYGRGCGKRRY